jgi:cytidylate kinase
VLPRRAGFSVSIVAPINYRVQQVVLRRGLSKAGARAYVEHSERQRIAFLERYFHRDISDPHVHDLVVNVEQLGIENALDLIVDGVRTWMQETEPKLVRPSIANEQFQS